jgi:hypothetical protein
VFDVFAGVGYSDLFGGIAAAETLDDNVISGGRAGQQCGKCAGKSDR